MTQTKDNQYKPYKDSKFLGLFPEIHFSDDEYWNTSEVVDGKTKYTLHLQNGKKFGLYEKVYPLINYDLPGRPIYGVEYQQNESRYVNLIENNKTVGPHEYISVFNTASNDRIILWKNGDKYYFSKNDHVAGPFLKINSSGKEIGPVFRHSTFVFSKSNKVMAENNQGKREIYIDEKLFSPGFCLTYNEKDNSFLWLSQIENKIYLHTFKN